jgi:hypothetical protein
MSVKPIQIVARFDNSIVALTAAGQLFGQVRGEWQPMVGPEGERVVSIGTRPNGGVIAIAGSGRIYEQHRVGVHIGDHSQDWRLLPALPDK